MLLLLSKRLPADSLVKEAQWTDAMKQKVFSFSYKESEVQAHLSFKTDNDLVSHIPHTP